MQLPNGLLLRFWNVFSVRLWVRIARDKGIVVEYGPRLLRVGFICVIYVRHVARGRGEEG